MVIICIILEHQIENFHVANGYRVHEDSYLKVYVEIESRYGTVILRQVSRRNKDQFPVKYCNAIVFLIQVGSVAPLIDTCLSFLEV